MGPKSPPVPLQCILSEQIQRVLVGSEKDFYLTSPSKDMPDYVDHRAGRDGSYDCQVPVKVGERAKLVLQ